MYENDVFGIDKAGFQLFISRRQEYTLWVLSRWKPQFFNLYLDITWVRKCSMFNCYAETFTSWLCTVVDPDRTNIITIVNDSSVSQFANLGFALERKIKDFGTLRRLIKRQ